MRRGETQPGAARGRLLRFVWENKLFWLVPLLLVLTLVVFLLCDPLPEVVPPFIYQ